MERVWDFSTDIASVGVLVFDFLENLGHDFIEEEFDAVKQPFQFILESSKIGGKEVEYCY